MIEIIREENWDDTKEKKLPKDIRQIGRPDVGERIYIEDEVYQYLHPYESTSEKIAYVLLGRFENYSGRQCTFVEAAIRLGQIEFDGEIPRWNDHEWGYIYKRLKDEYDSMVIAGWALDLRGSLPNMTKQIEQFHRTHFGGIHQILFLMDTLEREETFFSVRNGHLYRREGFYIYYDRQAAARTKARVAQEGTRSRQKDSWTEKAADQTVRPADHIAKAAVHSAKSKNQTAKLADQPAKSTDPAEKLPDQQENADGDLFLHQDEMVCERKENRNDVLEEELYIEESSQRTEVDISPQPEKKRQGRYRRQLEEEEKEEETKIPAYSSIVLAVVVLTLGFTAYQNHRKMNEMQDALAQMNQVHLVTETQETDTKTSDAGVVVENVAGTVEKQPAAVQQESAGTQAAQDGTTEIQQTTEQVETIKTPAATETGEMQDGTVQPESAGAESQKEEQETETAGTQPETKEQKTETADTQPETKEQKAETADTQPETKEQKAETAGTQPETKEQKAETAGTQPEQKAETASAQSEQKTETDVTGTENTDTVNAAAVQADEAQTYLNQGYYIVRQGDNLAAICRKIYKTTAMMDKVCEANGIDDPDAIYAGQYLTLPN